MGEGGRERLIKMGKLITMVQYGQVLYTIKFMRCDGGIYSINRQGKRCKNTEAKYQHLAHTGGCEYELKAIVFNGKGLEI